MEYWTEGGIEEHPRRDEFCRSSTPSTATFVSVVHCSRPTQDRCHVPIEHRAGCPQQASDNLDVGHEEGSEREGCPVQEVRSEVFRSDREGPRQGRGASRRVSPNKLSDFLGDDNDIGIQAYGRWQSQ